MFGYMRFVLAFLVLMSHVGIQVWGLNLGVSAVVVFYILAGYVVQHILSDILGKDGEVLVRMGKFYRDRLFRIFPLYLYFAGVSALFLLITQFGEPHFEFWNVVANLTIIPLNYFMYWDFTVLREPNWCLVPPAWSLGTELQAYLLLPFALFFRSVWVVLVFGSLMVYMAANFSILNTDYFGYRFIFGVFFIFAVGTAIQRGKFLFPFGVLTLVLMFGIYFWINDLFGAVYIKETFLGLAVGIPVVIFVSKIKKKFLFDGWMGSISYGMFLSHFLLMWIGQYAGYRPTAEFGYLGWLTFGSVLMSVVGILLVEKPLWKFRKKLEA